MLDLKFIRDNLDLVRQNIAFRGVRNADADAVVALYQQRNGVSQQLEAVRAERNETSQKMKGKLEPEERQALIERGKQLKLQLEVLEADERRLDEELMAAARTIPNMTHPAVPAGGEADSRVIAVYGQPTEFTFTPKDHVTLGMELSLLDFENAGTVTG